MEELKIILDAIENLGNNAQWLFIAYLIKEAIIYILGFSCLAGGLVGVYKILHHLIPALNFESRMERVMHYNWLSSERKNNILDILKKSRGDIK